MRQFLRLIDLAKSDGIGFYDDQTQGFKFMKAPSDFWEAVERCEPFVFSDTGPFVDNGQQHHRDKRGYDDRVDNAPFAVFSIEVAGDKPLAVYPTDEDETTQVLCIMVVELDPQKYIFLTLMGVERAGEWSMMLLPSNADGPAVKHYVDRLTKEQTGMETTRTKIKLGTGKEKRFHRISRVIHVKPKTDRTDSTGTRQVDWSHRFSVRGHWRKTDSIGKDRAGQYCVQGFTWVSEHIRGPEHLPYIRKTRLIEDQPKTKSDEPLKLSIVKTDE